MRMRILTRYGMPAWSDYLENFSFSKIHDKQINVLNEIRDAFNSGYK